MQRHYGWVVVAAGALLGCVGMGSLFSLAVFLDPIIADTGWSKAGVSAAMTVGFLAMGVGSFVWGAISDRYGPRVIGLAGAVLLSVGLLLASRAQTLLEFQLAYGLAIGAAAGAFFAQMMATASGWFAARPSGTEDVYKIYAESFLGPEHLAQVQQAARELVNTVIA